MALLWMNVNGLSPNPQHVVGDAQVSYDCEFPLEFPHACEVCTRCISSSSSEACEIYSKQFFFSSGGIKVCIPSSGSTQAGGLGRAQAVCPPV